MLSSSSAANYGLAMMAMAIPFVDAEQWRRHGATIGGGEDHLKSIISMHRP